MKVPLKFGAHLVGNGLPVGVRGTFGSVWWNTRAAKWGSQTTLQSCSWNGRNEKQVRKIEIAKSIVSAEKNHTVVKSEN